MGQHPIIKIIYIDDLLIPRALQIISDLNEKYPEHLDDQVSDDEDNAVRRAQRVPKLIFQCPACHMLFDCSLSAMLLWLLRMFKHLQGHFHFHSQH